MIMNITRSRVVNLTRGLRHSLRNSSSLVVGEHDGKSVSQGTLATITAASKLGGDVSLLLMGSGTANVSDSAAGIAGVTKVLCVNDDALDRNLAENCAAALHSIVKDKAYTHILAPSTNHGKNFIPRTAAMMDCAPLSDIIAVLGEDSFQRPMYAGNAMATVQMKDAIKFLLVRTTAFEKAAESGGSAGVEAIGVDGASANLSTWESESAKKSGRPDLSGARVVVSGGRGMKNGENFAMLEEMADKLGGAVGASRAAVDAGFVPNELQVGQTGKVVAPDLYVAVGISGAIAPERLEGLQDNRGHQGQGGPHLPSADFGSEDLSRLCLI